MANKKKIDERRKAQEAQKGERIIRLIGVVVVEIIVVVLAYLGIANLQNRPPVAPESGTRQYGAPPPMMIDVSKNYFAKFNMANGGEFTVRLFADKAPITVNNFVFLARDGYYDGVTFHRVIDGFMAQGGDPTGTGAGDPGYSFQDEISDLVFDRPGLLAMANAGPNTNGSQFFITYAPTPHLNGLHTIFGEVVEGMEVVNNLTRRDPNQSPDYPGDAIESVTITEE